MAKYEELGQEQEVYAREVEVSEEKYDTSTEGYDTSTEGYDTSTEGYDTFTEEYDISTEEYNISSEEDDTATETYDGFAQVYDMFMDNVPYDDWCSYLRELLCENDVTSGLVLDLGCGTGNVTERLAAYGYDMIGVDNSDEMLNIALEKREQSGQDILYLLQDMREFELYGTVRAVVSICDSMNYVTDSEEMKQVFSLVNNYLDIGGVFIFDLNTVFKYEMIGDATIAENREKGSFIWENHYEKETQINEYELTLFVREEAELYRKYVETHLQRGYTAEEIKTLLLEAGLELVAMYHAFTREAPRADSERIYVVAREKGKKRIGQKE